MTSHKFLCLNRDGYEYEFITRIVDLVSSKIKQDPFHVGDYPVGLESYSEAFNYDVFLSFRGSDTLHGFTGYLYKALRDSGIHTFIDEDLNRGEEITPAIVKAIEESRIAIIVLSINYASSSFCLDELATIRDCLERKRMLVLPVFYNVDHSQVRMQEGSYGEALVKHEEGLKHSMEKLEKWKMALHQVANLSDFKITTQDKQLLTSYDINRTYEVKKLNKDDALQLLKWKAFKMHYFDQPYEELLNRAVTCASSLPLTLEILASNLFGKSVKEWKSTFHQFERSPNNPIEMILKVIFYSLKEKEKSVLLDIACCFKGYELTEVQDILHAHYGHCMKYYINVLVDKSLVYISHGTEPCNDTITMHDLIAEEIVRQESMTKPGERRRLWSLEDVREVLGYNTVSETHEWFDLVF